ncbi:MAG: response regulator transcription factor [Candidatus Promineofilum sp.]|nr:response regulator transcription factor [Promineifilum sp.]MCW5863030.1 response regulator transcription factor [Anaerolineae bacterium]
MPSIPLVLLIEGVNAGRDSLQPMLLKAGYETTVVHTGAEALDWLRAYTPNLIVFDASTMRSNGVRNCRRLRRQAELIPIIHSRVAGEEEDRSAGADVYLERPFSARKLINRARALLPADSAREEIIRYGSITLFRGKRSVAVAGKGEFILTPKLALLLETFLRQPGVLLTRRELMQTVWQTDFVGDTRTLDVHIRWVRECIEDNPSQPEFLKTIRGKGYLMQIMKPATESNSVGQADAAETKKDTIVADSAS